MAESQSHRAKKLPENVEKQIESYVFLITESARRGLWDEMYSPPKASAHSRQINIMMNTAQTVYGELLRAPANHKISLNDIRDSVEKKFEEEINAEPESNRDGLRAKIDDFCSHTPYLRKTDFMLGKDPRIPVEIHKKISDLVTVDIQNSGTAQVPQNDIFPNSPIGNRIAGMYWELQVMSGTARVPFNIVEDAIELESIRRISPINTPRSDLQAG